MNRRLRHIRALGRPAITAAGLLLAATCASAQPGDIPESDRGIAGAINVHYPSRLRAKPSQTPNSPVLVRVLAGDVPGTQRVEFIGTVSGTYDLREFIEREDHGPIADLPAMTVRVVSQLPPEHGLDLFGETDVAFSLSAHYREVLIAMGALWLMVPAFFITRRLMRRVPEAAAVIAPPPRTLADDLRDMLDIAAKRPMTVPERGRLELLLLRFYRETAGAEGGGQPDLVGAVQRLREHAATRDIVLAVERWLHGPTGGADRPGENEVGALAAARAALGSPDAIGGPV